jgi:hypothetical protein
MNDTTTDLDQTDEDILTYTVFDEALEAAAGRSSAPSVFSHNVFPAYLACC